MGTLYLVATPIGNLEDITLRALRILREVDLIAAEDTRIARRLLDRYEIATPLISYHGDSPEVRAIEVIDRLESGDVAVISDAGMPGISDPGSRLVQLAVERGHTVVPIPGPTAVSTAAAASGAVDHGYIFAGFLPRRSAERRQRLRDLAAPNLPIILFESPNRVRALLEDVAAIFPDAEITAGREITKLHEQWLRGSPGDVLTNLTERGEFTLVIVPNLDTGEPQATAADLDQILRDLLSTGLSVRDAVDRAIAATGIPRRQVYPRALELREGME